MYNTYQDNLIQYISNNLEFHKWGFRLSYRSESSISVIFDSEWCKLKVSLKYEQNSKNEELNFSYARLHAPDERPYMIVNNDQFLCWHRSDFLCLFFLDGYQIEEIKNDYEFVPLIDRFWKSKEGSILRQKGTREFSMQIEKIIWDNYAPKLFELYDLRRPELWERYRKFLKSFYESKNWKSKSHLLEQTSTPPPWMIC